MVALSGRIPLKVPFPVTCFQPTEFGHGKGLAFLWSCYVQSSCLSCQGILLHADFNQSSQDGEVSLAGN